MKTTSIFVFVWLGNTGLPCELYTIFLMQICLTAEWKTGRGQQADALFTTNTTELAELFSLPSPPIPTELFVSFWPEFLFTSLLPLSIVCTFNSILQLWRLPGVRNRHRDVARDERQERDRWHRMSHVARVEYRQSMLQPFSRSALAALISAYTAAINCQRDRTVIASAVVSGGKMHHGSVEVWRFLQHRFYDWASVQTIFTSRLLSWIKYSVTRFFSEFAEGLLLQRRNAELSHLLYFHKLSPTFQSLL